MTLQRLLRITAWCGLLVIAVLSLSPKGTRYLAFMGDYSRAVAYLAVALNFSLAYPRHRGLVVVALICAAGTLEVVQTLIPHRHGRVHDFEVKVIGAITGAAVSIPVRRALSASGSSPGYG